MKSKIYAALAAAVLSIPVVASAQQSNAGLTRAEVRAELVQIEKAGYRPAHGNDPYYPADIQAASVRLQAIDSVTPAAATSGYGNPGDGFSQAGNGTLAHKAERSIYFGH
jgi:hypothetical protein